jgi:hypothetical protein
MIDGFAVRTDTRDQPRRSAARRRVCPQDEVVNVLAGHVHVAEQPLAAPDAVGKPSREDEGHHERGKDKELPFLTPVHNVVVVGTDEIVQ